MNRHSTKEEMWMASKHKKRCWILLAIGGCKLKPQGILTMRTAKEKILKIQIKRLINLITLKWKLLYQKKKNSMNNVNIMDKIYATNDKMIIFLVYGTL